MKTFRNFSRHTKLIYASNEYWSRRLQFYWFLKEFSEFWQLFDYLGNYFKPQKDNFYTFMWNGLYWELVLHFDTNEYENIMAKIMIQLMHSFRCCWIVDWKNIRVLHSWHCFVVTIWLGLVKIHKITKPLTYFEYFSYYRSCLNVERFFCTTNLLFQNKLYYFAGLATERNQYWSEPTLNRSRNGAKFYLLKQNRLIRTDIDGKDFWSGPGWFWSGFKQVLTYNSFMYKYNNIE